MILKIILIILFLYLLYRIFKVERFSSLSIEDIIKKYYKQNGFVSYNKEEYNSEYNYTYGEIEPNAMRNIYNYCRNKNSNIHTFYDLGCGIGKSLIMARELGFKNINGIEIVKERYEIGEKVISQYNQDKKANISYINGDMFDYPLDNFEPVCIFVSNLLFTPEINKKLVEKVEKEAKSGSLLFVSKELPESNRIKKIDVIASPMSWAADSKLLVYLVN